MRFLERTLSAIGYHRRAYVGEFIGAMLFCILSIILLTSQSISHMLRQEFLNRLSQLAGQTSSASTTVLTAVKNGYLTLNQQYQLAWWGLIGATMLLSFGFALWFSRHRAQETEAYLLLGKSTWAIGGQYLLESLLIFVLAFMATSVLGLLVGSLVGAHLVDPIRAALGRAISSKVTAGNWKQAVTHLFQHQLTGFSGEGLFVPGPPPGGLNQGTQLAGGFTTLLSGGLALAGGQALALWGQLWHQKRQLVHHQ